MNPKSNKKIYILDCDYLYATSNMPNYKVMKLYSYHTQLGNQVTFITEEYQLTGTHDVLYLIRELRNTPFPPGDILDDRRTILIGKEFEMFEDSQQLPNEAAVCRPDYTLYKYKEENPYSRASFVQFFNGNSLLKNVQDWRRSDARSVIIIDDNFWDASPQIIASCLNQLSEDHNILFLHPIKLKKLLEKDVYEAFLKLKLAKFGKLRYNNNIGEDYNSIIQIIDVMNILKDHFVYLNLTPISVKIITKDHWEDKANIYYDFERCLKIMNYAQKHRVRINFKYPRFRLSSPSWFYFEFFKTWGNHYHTLSYIEALLKGTASFHKKSYAAILNNSMLWDTAKAKQAVHLISRYPELIREYGLTGWSGVESTTSQLINYEYVKEKAIENRIF